MIDERRLALLVDALLRAECESLRAAFDYNQTVAFRYERYGIANGIRLAREMMVRSYDGKDPHAGSKAK